jgi:hypothetical protein
VKERRERQRGEIEKERERKKEWRDGENCPKINFQQNSSLQC